MGLTLEHIYLRDVFEDLTFTFETGKMTLLIGDTGAGKSTLITRYMARGHSLIASLCATISREIPPQSHVLSA